MTVSMDTVSIPNLDIKVCIHKSEVPQWNLLRSLNQPKITRQSHFKLTETECDLIKDEITSM